MIAVDQLGMGWSERTEAPRTLAQRIDDLGTVTAALGLTGPVVLLAHDWGGPVALGWALAHATRWRGSCWPTPACTSRSPRRRPR